MSVIHETGLITAPVSVYFETFAPAAATVRATIVMVHGGAHSGACYQRTADGRRGWAYLFAERGYRSVVPDWPGTGRSGYIPLDQLNGATVMEELGALIRSLGAPVILLTHSMSGCYGWRLLELHGDIIDRLVAFAPGPPRQHPEDRAGLCGNRPRDRDRSIRSARAHRQECAGDSHSRFRGAQAHRCEPIFPARADRPGYAASLHPIPPNILLERQNLHGRQVRVSDPSKLAGKRVLVITGTDDLDHAREVDGAIVTWLNGNGAKADFCFLGDRGIVGNGHMLMLEDNSDEIAGIILDWLEETAGDQRPGMR